MTGVHMAPNHPNKIDPRTISIPRTNPTRAAENTATIQSEEPVRPPEPKAMGNPLRRHSLRGDAAKLDAQAIDTRPLLGDFVMHGQATMIYAEPNAGKTLTVLRLIIDAIEAYHE